MEDLEEEFPIAPFDISCIEDMDELDETFTNEKEIAIYDDRAAGWFYDNVASASMRVSFLNYTIVKQIDDEPITLRQVIEAMIEDKHYHNDYAAADPHHFLEGFSKHTLNDVIYTACFGS